jgi:hypothetical protein
MSTKIKQDDDPDNYRNIQDRNGRVVYFYESPQCSKKHGKKTEEGHFEKVERKLVDYFFVPGSNPSGVAGAFHVSKAEATKNGKFSNLNIKSK